MILSTKKSAPREAFLPPMVLKDVRHTTSTSHWNLAGKGYGMTQFWVCDVLSSLSWAPNAKEIRKNRREHFFWTGCCLFLLTLFTKFSTAQVTSDVVQSSDRKARFVNKEADHHEMQGVVKVRNAKKNDWKKAPNLLPFVSWTSTWGPAVMAPHHRNTVAILGAMLTQTCAPSDAVALGSEDKKSHVLLVFLGIQIKSKYHKTKQLNLFFTTSMPWLHSFPPRETHSEPLGETISVSQRAVCPAPILPRSLGSIHWHFRHFHISNQVLRWVHHQPNSLVVFNGHRFAGSISLAGKD